MKTTAEDCRKLSVFDLNRLGVLAQTCGAEVIWTHSSGGKSSIGIAVDLGDRPCLWLHYTAIRNGEPNPHDYSVELVRTACNFGGVRYWFICPDCTRRVGVLYLAPGDEIFRCRHCLRLAYGSQNEWDPNGYQRFFTMQRRIEDLNQKIKRYFWRGQDTRKFRKMLALENRFNRLSESLSSILERKIKRFKKPH